MDAASGRKLKLRSTSVQWNVYRKRWIMLAQEVDGIASKLGEIWFLEAPTPIGPWDRARQVLTHDRYAFYEVVHHPALDQQGGRYIYFTGTYSDFLSNPKNVTPRYDYNLMMYRLDLSDTRLHLRCSRPDHVGNGRSVRQRNGKSTYTLSHCPSERRKAGERRHNSELAASKPPPCP